MLIGFVCAQCGKYVSGDVCDKCEKSPGNRNLNGNVINHIDTQWATENGGKGHYSHQYQRHFSSRKQLADHARSCGDSVVDGPMGTNVGNYRNPYTEDERKAMIRKDRRKAMEKAFGYR
jgi:hypothetical protein